ncbi:Mlo-related protein [Trema orientale]|uniref:MLO-like protein n=1 Tax=Trema orientale TaxID=63057 RepID=A0A2P5EY87_TREOI|nr:Mlo-related protein [Trema orientale]
MANERFHISNMGHLHVQLPLVPSLYILGSLPGLVWSLKMGGGGGSSTARELDQTPTWAVASVCAVIIVISIILEKVLHLVGEWFQERKKKALFEALQKVKGGNSSILINLVLGVWLLKFPLNRYPAELMVLGFISLIMTFGQNYIARICIPMKIAGTMLPCPYTGSDHSYEAGHEPETNGGKHEHHRKLLWYERRFLAAGSVGADCKLGYVPLISLNGLHQLHIFIFFLALFHVIYSAITMTLGRLKIRGWKDWERETAHHQEYMNDPSRFRLTHETSFVKDHTRFWTKTPITFYSVCFLRQFIRSVRKADYLTMRHGFVSVHLAPGSKFDFQKYIKRSLEDDFKVVVGITPLLWTSMVFFLLLNVHGWQAMFWLSMLPLVVTLAVGTKLQGIITQMALEIQERHAVVQGIPLVQVSDRHFWFSRPELILHLIHFVLFQNAFEITYFFWIWYEFGLRSCFHEDFNLIILRVALGVVVQFVCSYVTLPLYALVTQMGSTMKRSIFDEQTSKALKNWHKNAVKKKDEKPPTRVLGGSPGDSPIHSPTHPQAHKPAQPPPDAANIMASVDIHQPPSTNTNTNTNANTNHVFYSNPDLL